MPDLAIVSKAACLPLFLLAAWLTSYRSLSDRLAYRLPLSLQFRMPAIRRYWLCDLVLSLVAFILAFFVARVSLLSGYVGQEFLAAERVSWSILLDPLLATALGCTWPKTSTVVLGTERGRSVSLGRIRDLLLGGKAIDTVNLHVAQAVDDYLGRVMASSDVDARIIVGDARPDLAALRQLASENFERLYLSVSKQTMIPFPDRLKCLMSIPGMTSSDEERLYQAGVTRLSLMFGAPVEGFDASRWAQLRQSARALFKQRLCAAGAVTTLALALFGVGFLMAPLMSPGLPVASGGGSSPIVSTESEANAAASTFYVNEQPAPRDESGRSR